MTRHLALLVIAVACSGCFRSTTMITVRADGSGVIDQEMGANPQAAAMLKGFSGSASGQQAGESGPTEFFGREQAEKLGAQMGVRFVSGEPVKTADLDGYRAHYAFDDITKLTVPMNQDPTGGLGGSARQTSTPPLGFDFERRGAASLLTIRMPEQKTMGLGADGPLGRIPGASGDTQEGAQALSMMKMMMRGLFVDVTLAVDGRLVKTNAPHVNGSRITLIQMDFDKLIDTPGALQKLQRASDASALKDIPGLKITTDPKVSIEFAR
jgi:hypothetical protein